MYMIYTQNRIMTIDVTLLSQSCGYLELLLYDPEYAFDEQWRYTGGPNAD